MWRLNSTAWKADASCSSRYSKAQKKHFKQKRHQVYTCLNLVERVFGSFQCIQEVNCCLFFLMWFWRYTGLVKIFGGGGLARWAVVTCVRFIPEVKVLLPLASKGFSADTGASKILNQQKQPG